MTKYLPDPIKKLIKSSFFYKAYQNHLYKRNTRAEVLLNIRQRAPLLKEYIPPDGIGAELGVLKGNFSKVLLDATQAKELHLIDPWYFLDSHWTWAGDNTSTIDALCKVLQENKSYIEQKRISVHVQDDLKALVNFPDGYFDWVYIDSSHNYEHTKSELELLRFKVKKSGIICGDDWCPDPNHRHHGVYKAVKEFIKTYEYRLIYADEDNRQWFICKI